MLLVNILSCTGAKCRLNTVYSLWAGAALHVGVVQHPYFEEFLYHGLAGRHPVFARYVDSIDLVVPGSGGT